MSDRLWSFITLLGSLALSCGSDDSPANVVGTYSINTTNGESTCSFEWAEGESATGVPVTFTQNGAAASATVGGVAAVALGLLVGTNQFDGSVQGRSLTLTAYGKIPRTSGNCTYTVNATIQATISGDTLEGTVTYAPAGNGNPDCDAVRCSAVQQFNGARPPTH
jgi:hypothetical protein